MSQIPTIPGSEQVEYVGTGVKRDVGPQLQRLQQVRRTAGAADDAVQEGISVIEGYELRKRKAEEVYAHNMASLSLQKMTGDFRSKIKTMPDQEIVPTWEKQAQAWKDSQLSQYGATMTPRTKKNFGMMLDMGVGDARIEFQVQADKLGSQRRESAARANFEEFVKTGDPAMAEKAKTAINLAVRAGDMTPEMQSELIAQIPQRLAVAQAGTMIQHAPGVALQKLAAGDWPEIKDEKVRSQMETLAKNQQNDNLRVLSEKYINPKTGDVDPYMIAGAIHSGNIDQTAGRNLLAAQERKSKAADSQLSQVILAAMNDPQTWKGAESIDAAANELTNNAYTIKDAAVRAKTLSAIDKEKASYIKTGVSTLHPLVEAQIHEDSKDREESGLFLPPIHTEAKTTKSFWGKKTTEPETVKKVYDSLEKLRKARDSQGNIYPEIAEVYGTDSNASDILDQERANWAKYQHDFMQQVSALQAAAAGKEIPDFQQKLAEISKNLKRKYVMDQLTAKLQPTATAQSKPKATPKEGQTATDANGNKAKWENGTWVEVK